MNTAIANPSHSGFQKAQKVVKKARIGICGVAGSGKTLTALKLARSLGKKIALVDTENNSSVLYGDRIDFDVLNLEPPFEVSKYIEAIHTAESAGYDVLIIDSLSHAWTGEGGVLDMHEKAATAAKGNSWAAWREVTPLHNAFVDAMLGANLHIIATMRTKTAYEVTDSDGKKKPVKVGLAPVQRDGMEYEFTAVLDLTVDAHIATASKDRTRLFDGKHFTPAPKTGETLREWLETGIDPREESRKLLETLKVRVDETDSTQHLNDWWRKHSPDIATLIPADRHDLTAYCAARKETLLAAAQRERGNGEDKAALAVAQG